MMIGYLCQRLSLDDETKADMVYSCTAGRVERTRDTTSAEAADIIEYLVRQSDLPPSARDKMKRKILSLAHEMRWELPNGSVDMVRVDNWCIRFSGKEKGLDDFSYNELPALVTQFEKVYRDFLKGI